MKERGYTGNQVISKKCSKYKYIQTNEDPSYRDLFHPTSFLEKKWRKYCTRKVPFFLKSLIKERRER